jgi:hypothetical protein
LNTKEMKEWKSMWRRRGYLISEVFMAVKLQILVLKVCDDATLVQILCFWTLSIVQSVPKNIVLFIFLQVGTSSIDWAQLRRFYLKTEIVSSL